MKIDTPALNKALISCRITITVPTSSLSAISASIRPASSSGFTEKCFVRRGVVSDDRYGRISSVWIVPIPVGGFLSIINDEREEGRKEERINCGEGSDMVR
jgi:hypothetical protein